MPTLQTTKADEEAATELPHYFAKRKGNKHLTNLELSNNMEMSNRSSI